MKQDPYPLPKIEDLFVPLVGGTIFSKLNLNINSCISIAALYVGESKDLLRIYTYCVLFKNTQFPFGVSSAPGVFQKVTESVLQDDPNVLVRCIQEKSDIWCI